VLGPAAIATVAAAVAGTASAAANTPQSRVLKKVVAQM
jgi:hypothetical protein